MNKRKKIEDGVGLNSEKKEEEPKKWGGNVTALIKIKKDGTAEVLENESLEAFFIQEQAALSALTVSRTRYSQKNDTGEITWHPITKEKICELME